ncbi:hypothetical protein LXA39_17545, partial [Erwinia amylovora]|uniref:hypothetical protein n=1 Tax=Erwinia amylovora TaxID=552 RepID=UPI0020BF1777
AFPAHQALLAAYNKLQSAKRRYWKKCRKNGQNLQMQQSVVLTRGAGAMPAEAKVNVEEFTFFIIIAPS